MNGVVLVVATYVLLAIESPLLQEIHVSIYAPDVALVAVLLAAWTMPWIGGLLTALAVGLLHDAFAMSGPPGLHAEIAVLVFMAAWPLVRRLSPRSTLAVVAVTFVASLLSSGLFFVLTAIFDRHFAAYGLIGRAALPNALVTVPVAALLFPVLARVGVVGRRRLPFELTREPHR